MKNHWMNVAVCRRCRSVRSLRSLTHAIYFNRLWIIFRKTAILALCLSLVYFFFFGYFLALFLLSFQVSVFFSRVFSPLINDVFDALFYGSGRNFVDELFFYRAQFFFLFASRFSWFKCLINVPVFVVSYICTNIHVHFSLACLMSFTNESLIERLKTKYKRTKIDSNCKNHVQFAPPNRKITHETQTKSGRMSICLFVCLWVYVQCVCFFCFLYLHNNLFVRENVYVRVSVLAIFHKNSLAPRSIAIHIHWNELV